MLRYSGRVVRASMLLLEVVLFLFMLLLLVSLLM